MNEYPGMVTPTELRNLAEGLEAANHNAEQIAKLFKQAAGWKRCAAKLMPSQPESDPSHGPCCHELEDCNGTMYWICTGCYCGNYDDAQSASQWAKEMKRWIDAQKILAREGLER